MLSKALVGLFLFASHAKAIASEEKDSTISYKKKLSSLIKERHDGVATFDHSISEEMAKEEYNKHMKGYYEKLHSKTLKNENNVKNSERSLLVTNGEFDSSDKDKILQIHNDYRLALCSRDGSVKDSSGSTYTGCSDMNYLFWDDALEKIAQGWSDTLASNCGGIWHNDDPSDELVNTYSNYATFEVPGDAYVGENVGYSGTTSSTVSLDHYTNPLVAMWEDEMTDWSYKTYSSGTINGAGHFTQMAWADTRYVGCAGASCTSGSWYNYYITCNYYPGGNYDGQYPWTSSSSCTQNSNNCDGDRTDQCVSSSLCRGCMDPAYDYSGSTSSSTDCRDDGDVPAPSPTASPVATGDLSCGSCSNCYACIYITNFGSYFATNTWTEEGCYGSDAYYKSTIWSDTFYIYKSQVSGSWYVNTQFNDYGYYAFCSQSNILNCDGQWETAWEGQQTSSTTDAVCASGYVIVTDDNGESGTNSDDDKSITIEEYNLYSANCSNNIYGDNVCIYNPGSLWSNDASSNSGNVGVFDFMACHDEYPMYSYYYSGINSNGNDSITYILHYERDYNKWIISKNTHTGDRSSGTWAAYCEETLLTDCTYETWYVFNNPNNDTFANIESSMGYDSECTNIISSSLEFCNNYCVLWEIELKIESDDNSINICDDTYVSCISYELASDAHTNVIQDLQCNNNDIVYAKINASIDEYGYDAYSTFLNDYNSLATTCLAAVTDDDTSDITITTTSYHVIPLYQGVDIK